jgi:hypothetical protein
LVILAPGPGVDLVVAGHFAFILFALFGAALLVRWPRLVWVHVPALAWGAYIEASGAICPLTPLEMQLRAAAGQGGYGGGFIDHYLTPVIYPEGLTRGTQWIFSGILVAINLLLYARWWLKRRR